MAAAQSDEDTQDTGTTPAGSSGAKSERTAPVSAASRHAARRAAKAAAKAAKRGTDGVMPTEVQQTVEHAAAAYQKNARVLWGAIGALVVASVGAYFAHGYMEQQSHASADALSAGIDVARAQIVKEGEEPADDDNETFTSTEARAKKAAETYASAEKQAGDSLAGRWAALGEANALEQLGKHAEAEKAFAKLANDSDPFIAARATEGAGFALEAQQKYAEAATRYEALAKQQNGALKVIADYHRARMLIAQGKQRDAALVLEALLKAERGKPETAPSRFENVIGDAETLLTELSISLNHPKLRADIPKARASSSMGMGLNEDIMNQLRLQLGQGEGGDNALSPELLKALQQQLGGSAPGHSAPAAPAEHPAAP